MNIYEESTINFWICHIAFPCNNVRIGFWAFWVSLELDSDLGSEAMAWNSWIKLFYGLYSLKAYKKVKWYNNIWIYVTRHIFDRQVLLQHLSKNPQIWLTKIFFLGEITQLQNSIIAWAKTTCKCEQNEHL